jgi:hypothetical protein
VLDAVLDDPGEEALERMLQCERKYASFPPPSYRLRRHVESARPFSTLRKIQKADDDSFVRPAK